MQETDAVTGVILSFLHQAGQTGRVEVNTAASVTAAVDVSINAIKFRAIIARIESLG